MTSDEELAEMRRQYEHAQLETHMLVDGKVRLRCVICKVRPVPDGWCTVRWCDPCLDEGLNLPGTVSEVVAELRRQAGTS